MTNEELKDLIASNAIAIAELRESQKETDRQVKETSRQLREARKQIGDLGNKFGSFAEGMALPSMQALFKKKFGMKEVTPRRKRHLNGRTLELDALAFGEPDEPTAYVIEVKSHLKDEDILQLLKTIEEFPKFFDEHAHRKVYGVVVGVDVTEPARQVAFQNGIYLARLNDEVFTLETPPNFKPKAFGPFTNGTAQEKPAERKRGKKKKKR